ncbi:imidazole glycerol phosphate synthase subunit HisH [Zavarzinia compransoris]|uniref:imidazole glycerol phosphate synthase subunit HisH n=1 Tax=Zavarzinia marina TaxID=2911065 RepID=UPI001F31B67E|nr:imidazole glycerol phosphate synthase subunit HisH [Zavarzinia marina]MCF4167517.1 imidazole glycerol phosphate synthase subunit HisH [Zavarzinia marina]
MSAARPAVAIVDYGAGNLRSAAKAFERMGADVGLRPDQVVVTDRPEVVAAADRVVLPGDGAFAHCKTSIAAIPGMMDALHEQVVEKARPFFGICIGMQLMATEGHEHGHHAGFGWVPGTVDRLTPVDPALKIPHMGWNNLHVRHHHPVMGHARSGEHAYFVHSYALQVERDEDLVATADYAGPVTAIIARDNMFGTQFHPEKSQSFGLSLIAGFLRWRP